MFRSMWLDNLWTFDDTTRLSHHCNKNLTGLLVHATVDGEFKYIGVIVKHIPRSQCVDVYLTRIAE